MSDAIISIRNVTKSFGSSVTAVDNISFDIKPNEFFALLGPSGCGKTTLLRMIAGLETPTSGQIILDGRDMLEIPPNKRPVNMVFQSYAVFPHMSVEDNVAYGLRVTGVARDETAKRVAEALEMVKLGHLAKRKPHQLSGGQRQRVALARALVKRPKVLLLDEPLSALDAKLREQMQLELASLQSQVGITFIIVTHDQDEALSMADRIAVMEAGHIRQIATPAALYEAPVSRFVADFIGKVNLLDAKVVGSANGKVEVDVERIGRARIPYEGTAPAGAVSIAVRPEKVQLSKSAPGGDLMRAEGKIAAWAYYGDVSHMYVDTKDGLRLSVNMQNATRNTVHGLDIGHNVWVSWAPDDVVVLAQ
ncbi:MAG: ABC transporter ATP-binding protein [Hyphomicrobiaceae bacterium]